MGEFITVAKLDDLKPGSCKHVNANGKEIALFNVDGEILALDGACPHQGGPLGDGELNGTVVTCPWHGWEWDVKTGSSTQDPEMKVPKIEVKIEGDEIKIKS